LIISEKSRNKKKDFAANYNRALSASHFGHDSKSLYYHIYGVANFFEKSPGFHNNAEELHVHWQWGRQLEDISR
jgi:hypothetical protein